MYKAFCKYSGETVCLKSYTLGNLCELNRFQVRLPDLCIRAWSALSVHTQNSLSWGVGSCAVLVATA